MLDFRLMTSQPTTRFMYRSIIMVPWAMRVLVRQNHSNFIKVEAGWYDFDSADGQPFSTIDRINDPDPRCQHDYKMG